jgi:hypothetical protein
MDIPLYKSATIFYPFTSRWTFKLFLVLTFMNKAPMNIHGGVNFFGINTQA